MQHYARLAREPEGSYCLLGPRGTGKSSLLRHRYPDGLHLDLLDAALDRELSARPERLADLVAPLPPDRIVVLDEVERVPELLNTVHRLIERDRRRFVLSGSSARKLRRGGTNLLGGRAAMTSLGPFPAAELEEDSSLEDAVRVGLIPLILASPEPGLALRDCVELYVREEVRAGRADRERVDGGLSAHRGSPAPGLLRALRIPWILKLLLSFCMVCAEAAGRLVARGLAVLANRGASAPRRRGWT